MFANDYNNNPANHEHHENHYFKTKTARCTTSRFCL